MSSALLKRYGLFGGRQSRLSPIVLSPFFLVCVGLCLLCGMAGTVEASCSSKLNSTTSGSCVIYPTEGLCGSAYAGRSIFLPNDTSFAMAEKLAAESISLIKRNAEQVSDLCITSTEKYVCNRWFPSCVEIDGVAIPQLTCQSSCEDYWQDCKQAFDIYLNVAIKLYHVTTIENINLVHCGSGTWESEPQPSDRFGVRHIPQSPTWLEGYRGELQSPPVAGIFQLPNGTNVSIPCETIIPLNERVVTDLTCAYPLIKFTEGNEEFCALPCPFPVIDLADLKAIGWAFVAPGILGMVFSVFVCLDTFWVMFDATNGAFCYERARKYWANTKYTSRQEGSSAADVGTADSSTGSSKYRRYKIRSSTIYALLGSALGIVYFIIGPLMTLIRFENISCGKKPYFDASDLLEGEQEMGDSLCKAQRIAPFILQGVFNLMLYALFRVLLMVDQRFKKWPRNQLQAVKLAVFSYCAFGPFVTMGIALGVDKTTNDIVYLFGQLARNSAICTMRLTIVQEMFLVFIPFIITGCSVTTVSLYIWIHLSSIQAGVKDIVSDHNKNSDRNLRLLMRRLSVLGVATFVVIIVLMGATGYLINSMETFSPRFNEWFACESTSSTCASSTVVDCPTLRTAAYEVSPPSAAFAVQIAAMSCISLLLSGFFAAQAAPRLFREWWDGSLTQKLDNILEGRPLHYRVGRNGMSSAGVENVKSSPPETEITKKNRVAPGSSSPAAAAYMVGNISDSTSPVFEHEMNQSLNNGLKRAESASSG